jgi:hypothetical protein
MENLKFSSVKWLYDKKSDEYRMYWFKGTQLVHTLVVPFRDEVMCPACLVWRGVMRPMAKNSREKLACPDCAGQLYSDGRGCTCGLMIHSSECPMGYKAWHSL